MQELEHMSQSELTPKKTHKRLNQTKRKTKQKNSGGKVLN